jgi:hypothetical protein
MTGALGKKTWLIPDGFWPSKYNGQQSHEAICVINAENDDAEIEITLFFEEQPEMGGFQYICPARRTKHIRMDKLKSKNGKPVPIDTPYAMLVQSNNPIVVQYSRMDTSQCEMALMSTIAYPVE